MKKNEFYRITNDEGTVRAIKVSGEIDSEKGIGYCKDELTKLWYPIDITTGLSVIPKRELTKTRAKTNEAVAKYDEEINNIRQGKTYKKFIGRLQDLVKVAE